MENTKRTIEETMTLFENWGLFESLTKGEKDVIFLQLNRIAKDATYEFKKVINEIKTL